MNRKRLLIVSSICTAAFVLVTLLKTLTKAEGAGDTLLTISQAVIVTVEVVMLVMYAYKGDI